MRTRLTALLAALALIAGCGGDDKKSDSGGGSGGGDTAQTTTAPDVDPGTDPATDDPALDKYRAGFIKAAGKYKAATEAAAKQVQQQGSLEARLKGLDGLKTAAAGAAADFSKLEAPAKLKPDNDKLVEELRGFASSIEDVSAAARSGDAEAAQKALGELQDAPARINGAIDAIRSAIGN